MAAGLPVIASNFPMWEKIINEENCGICVDPTDPLSISKAIEYLVDHPVEVEKMGQRGVEAAQRKYNWSVEEKKLIEIYRTIETQ